MKENFISRYEQFAATIIEHTENAHLELPSWIDDSRVCSVGCVDSLTTKGIKNPPGGLIFLENERVLERFIKVRAKAGVRNGVLMAHLNCGYMRVIMKMDSLRDQLSTIGSAMQKVKELNVKYKTNYQVLVEKIGSATPYMRK